MVRPISYANVASSLALVVALSGASYAVATLPKDSVGTGQIKDRAVTKAKLAKGMSVRGPKGERGPKGPPGKLAPAQPAILVTPASCTNPGVPGAFGCELTGEYDDIAVKYVNFGQGLADASYRLDALGNVHLQGVVKETPGDARGYGCSESVGPIFLLPEGYRPAKRLVFAVASNDAFGRVDVTPAGLVKCVAGAQASYVSLDGISFPVAP